MQRLVAPSFADTADKKNKKNKLKKGFR